MPFELWDSNCAEVVGGCVVCVLVSDDPPGISPDGDGGLGVLASSFLEALPAPCTVSVLCRFLIPLFMFLRQ